MGALPALTLPLLVPRLEAATRRTASLAMAASCTTTWSSPASPAPSLTSLGLPTPTVVSASIVPGQSGQPPPSHLCSDSSGDRSRHHFSWKTGTTGLVTQ